MRLADPTQLQASANADPEFRVAARYWNATLSLESPSRAFRVEITDGSVASCRESEPGQPATITVVASEEGWAQFLARLPRPFYQDLLGCVQHHGFAVKGDAALRPHGRVRLVEHAGRGQGARRRGAGRDLPHDTRRRAFPDEREPRAVPRVRSPGARGDPDAVSALFLEALPGFARVSPRGAEEVARGHGLFGTMPAAEHESRGAP